MAHPHVANLAQQELQLHLQRSCPGLHIKVRLAIFPLAWVMKSGPQVLIGPSKVLNCDVGIEGPDFITRAKGRIA